MAKFSSADHAAVKRSIVIRAVLAALILGAGYLVFEFGRIQAGYNLLAAAEDRDFFEEQIAQLENDNLALNEQIAMLETHRSIDREAYSEVESSLTRLQAKIREQQDAIAFYRGIVSPADGKAGLRVQNFRLARGAHEREYTIRVVLTQAMKHDRKVSGDVRLRIAGVENGREKTYSYSELRPADDESKWAFSFRYFQDFDRQIVLPDGFEPETITVMVESKTSSIASVEASYPWLATLG